MSAVSWNRHHDQSTSHVVTALSRLSDIPLALVELWPRQSGIAGVCRKLASRCPERLPRPWESLAVQGPPARRPGRVMSPERREPVSSLSLASPLSKFTMCGSKFRSTIPRRPPGPKSDRLAVTQQDAFIFRSADERHCQMSRH